MLELSKKQLGRVLEVVFVWRSSSHWREHEAPIFFPLKVEFLVSSLARLQWAGLANCRRTISRFH